MDLILHQIIIVVFSVAALESILYFYLAVILHSVLNQLPISPVPDRRCRVVPEVVLVRRGVFGVLGIWKREGWGGGGSRRVSLQAT